MVPAHTASSSATKFALSAVPDVPVLQNRHWPATGDEVDVARFVESCCSTTASHSGLVDSICGGIWGTS
jgi:hypothetical protein